MINNKIDSLANEIIRQARKRLDSENTVFESGQFVLSKKGKPKFVKFPHKKRIKRKKQTKATPHEEAQIKKQAEQMARSSIQSQSIKKMIIGNDIEIDIPMSNFSKSAETEYEAKISKKGKILLSEGESKINPNELDVIKAIGVWASNNKLSITINSSDLDEGGGN